MYKMYIVLFSFILINFRRACTWCFKNTLCMKSDLIFVWLYFYFYFFCNEIDFVIVWINKRNATHKL